MRNRRRSHWMPQRSLIRLIGVIVPRRLRADWQQEWEAELRHRESRLEEWDRLDWHNKLDLIWRSTSAFWDAIWLQTYRWEDAMIQDLRFGARMLLKNPGFAVSAVLLLALGIGANTAIFSVVDAALLKMLPLKEPERLVLLSHTNAGKHNNGFSYLAYEHFRDGDRTLSGVLAYYPTRLTVSVDGQPEPAIEGQLVTGTYFQVLGVNAVVGRTIAPEDDRQYGGHPVCVISHSYWLTRFGRDPSVIGKTIHIGGFPFTVIGVTPSEFFGLEVGSSMDISIPITMQQQAMAGSRSFVEEEWEYFRLAGRLGPGVSMEEAQASLGLLYQQYVDDLVVRWSGYGLKGKEEANTYKTEATLTLSSGSRGLSELRRQFSKPLLLLMGVVGLVLLIACANVAGLMLARGIARRKEMAVRLALGAGRFRLVRQLLTESVLLSGLGGFIGLFFAWWGTRLLLPLLSQRDVPLHLSFNPDLRILGFTASVALLTGVLFGLAPAFSATRVELQSALKLDSRAKSGRSAGLGFGQLFVIAQVALSLLLLVGAGLFVRSLQKLQRVETGYVRENVLVLKLEPVGSDNKHRVLRQLTALYDELLRRVKAMPGVVQASLVGYSPISRAEWLVMGENPQVNSPLFVRGRTPLSPPEMWVQWMQVFPNSFETLGIPLVAGRDFNEQDLQRTQELAVINESMARRFFSNENPVGQRFGIGSPENPGNIIEIIGVVKDAKYISLREAGRPMFYRAFSQATTSFGQMTLVARTEGDPSTLTSAVQREARALDPAMPVFTAETLDAQLDASLSQERLLAMLSSLFGGLALLLACIGLYGVMAYSVVRRTHEIGIRMALGAQRRSVVGLVMRQTILLVVIGVCIGLGVALASTHWLTSFLYGLSPHDPPTVAIASLLLLLVASLAIYLPARRAAQVDPMVALRHE